MKEKRMRNEYPRFDPATKTFYATADEFTYIQKGEEPAHWAPGFFPAAYGLTLSAREDLVSEFYGERPSDGVLGVSLAHRWKDYTACLVRCAPDVYARALSVLAHYAMEHLYHPTEECVDAPVVDEPVHVTDLLKKCEQVLGSRAKQRDAGSTGERSMAKIVTIFNAWTGNTLSEEDGWRFCASLKMARETRGAPEEDSYVDLMNYIGLLGECRLNSPKELK